MNALIIANGQIPNHRIVKKLATLSDQIVCADGGANWARKIHIRPDIILGDFDSITDKIKKHFQNVSQVFMGDQNNTDLEKAILFCIDRKIISAFVVGAFGDRLDHVTGSLGCFKKYGKQINLIFFDTIGTIILVDNEVSLNMRKGEKLSLIPLNRCRGVTTKNLKYPLKNDTLELGNRESISNEAVSRNVSISVKSGTLLLYRFHHRF
jgi:thiamine pyrophosphokinase